MATTDRQRAADRRYRERHPEKYAEKQRRYRAANREKVRAGYARLVVEWHAWVDAMKLESGCVDCGYAEHAEALDFDHLPGTTKVLSVSKMIAGSRERTLAEIAKCEVVCANCHRVRTASRR